MCYMVSYLGQPLVYTRTYLQRVQYKFIFTDRSEIPFYIKFHFLEFMEGFKCISVIRVQTLEVIPFFIPWTTSYGRGGGGPSCTASNFDTKYSAIKKVIFNFLTVKYSYIRYCCIDNKFVALIWFYSVFS